MTIEEMLRIKEKKWKAEGKADTMEEFLAKMQGLFAIGNQN